jgi:hypothetical protein
MILDISMPKMDGWTGLDYIGKYNEGTLDKEVMSYDDILILAKYYPA